MRILIGLAIAIVAASCNAGMQMSAGVSVGATETGGYAVMHGVPVVGGELRLVVPEVVIVEQVERQVVGFPLKHTAIDAKVGGMMAVYEIVQTFENPFDHPIEAVYVFPLGDDSAVSGYEIRIGERTITGEIQTKENAREIYESAKSSGHTAALIEQNKTNIFTQKIANIAPHETIHIKISYTELLDYDNGKYTMAIPLTVGPRYTPKGNQGKSPPPAIAYADASQARSTVSFTANIDAGVPIIGVESPSHDIVSNPLGPTKLRVDLNSRSEVPNRDLVVKIKTAGPETTIGLVTHRVDNDGFFMLAVQPKEHYVTSDIRPREVVIVIDRSGSMDGRPLDQAKALANAIIGTLKDHDAVNVIAFASGVQVMAPHSVRADSGGKSEAKDYVDHLRSGGGTEMEAGVISMLTSTPSADRIRVVYFLTDGFVGNDDVVVGAARKYLGTNRVFTVGVGSSVNRALLDRLALAGRGFPSYLAITEDPAKLAKELVKKSAYPYLTDISIDWGGLRVDEVTPALVPDVYMGQPMVVSGRYVTPGSATIKVNAMAGGRRVTIPIAVQLPAYNDFEPAASLWARRKIEALDVLAATEDVRKPITDLGLRFHLVTEYTSFVAVDRSRTVSNGQPRVVDQPLLVPEDVNPATTVGHSYSSSSSSSSRRSRSSDSGGGGSWFGGGGGGGWGGGGPRDTRTYLVFLLFALVGSLWLIARRHV